MPVDLTKYPKAANKAAPTPAPAPQQTQNAYNPQAILDGLGQATESTRYPPFPTGQYIVAIEGVKLFQSTQNPSSVFVVEGTIVEAIVGEGQVGMTCSWVQKIDPAPSPKTRPMQLGAVKSFVLAVAAPKDAEEKAIIEAEMTAMVKEATENGTFNGDTVRVTSTPKVIATGANAGKIFQVINFTPHTK